MVPCMQGMYKKRQKFLIILNPSAHAKIDNFNFQGLQVRHRLAHIGISNVLLLDWFNGNKNFQLQNQKHLLAHTGNFDPRKLLNTLQHIGLADLSHLDQPLLGHHPDLAEA